MTLTVNRVNLIFLYKISFNKAIVQSKNEDKENNIITFAKGIFFYPASINYKIHLYAKCPFTPFFIKNKFPLSGYLSKSSSLKFSLAVVIIK